MFPLLVQTSSSLAASASASLAATVTDVPSPQPQQSVAGCSSGDEAEDDAEFAARVERNAQQRQRKWMSGSLSMQSPSLLAARRERERQHLQKLHTATPQALPTVCAVDFSRSDSSLIAQLLAFAAERTGSGCDAAGSAASLTSIRCVPTAAVLPGITRRHREGRGRSGTSALPPPSPSVRERFGSTVSPLSPPSPLSPANFTFPALPLAGSSAQPGLSSSSFSLPGPQLSNSSPSRDTALKLVGDAMLDGQLHSLYAANITYPLHWCPALHLSPFHIDGEQQSEREVIRWCQTVFGSAVVTEAVVARLEALESARWSAFLAPFAADDYGSLLGCFLALFVIIDDQLIEQAAKLGLSSRQLRPFADAWRFAADRRAGQKDSTLAVGQKLRELSARLGLPLLDSCFSAVWQLSDSYAALGAGPGWCGRMAAAWQEYIELGIREAVAADRINAAASQITAAQPLPPLSLPLTRYDHPSLHSAAAAGHHRLQGRQVLEVLARQRVASIGLPMIVLQLERACGLCLDSLDSLLQPAVQLLSLLPALVNELVGLARDLREGDSLVSTNFTLVQRRLCQSSLAHAVDFTVCLHDAAVAAVDVSCAHLLAHPAACSPALQQRLAVYLDRLRQCVRGYAQWHHHAARYKSVMAVDDTDRAVFIFPVHDGHATKQKDAAILDTLHQYQQHADKG